MAFGSAMGAVRASAAVAVVALALAACTHSDNSTPSGGGVTQSSTKPAAVTKGGNLRIVAVMGPLTDNFFPPIYKGMTEAASNLGVTLDYLSAPEDSSFAASYAKLLQEAVAQKPAGIILGDYIPSAFDPVIKRAVAAGIPVILDQDGQTNWQPDGAIGYVGQNVYTIGGYAAKAFQAARAKHVLCLDKGSGNPYLEEICASVASAMKTSGGDSKTFAIPLSDTTNPSTESQDIKAQLQTDPGIDGLFIQGASDGTAAAAALSSLGLTGKDALGVLALSKAVLASVQSGTTTFALDEQPYLDGYYGVQMMTQYVRYGLRPTNPIYLGYITIDKSNVASVINFSDGNQGVRGAS